MDAADSLGASSEWIRFFDLGGVWNCRCAADPAGLLVQPGNKQLSGEADRRNDRRCIFGGTFCPAYVRLSVHLARSCAVIVWRRESILVGLWRAVCNVCGSHRTDRV